MIQPIHHRPVSVECAAPPRPGRCRTSDPPDTSPTPRARPRYRIRPTAPSRRPPALHRHSW